MLWFAGKLYSNKIYRTVLNRQREKINLPPVKDVLGYLGTEPSWLAADPVIAPAPQNFKTSAFQSGTWILQGDNPLTGALKEFLENSEPPINFGFGSMGTRKDVSNIFIGAARNQNCRAILSKGWENLSLGDTGNDCIVIDEVNHELLLPHVACIVHHGGAGTTTTAARAGIPQVIVPHINE